jgi:hypothetical protein
MTTEDAVAAIAEVMADAEGKAVQVRNKVRGLKEKFEAIHANGDAGYLATKSFFTELDALATKFEADLFDAHRRMTIYAQERNIDVPGIQGGGGR